MYPAPPVISHVMGIHPMPIRREPPQCPAMPGLTGAVCRPGPESLMMISAEALSDRVDQAMNGR
jgi:hypothetical protein